MLFNCGALACLEAGVVARHDCEGVGELLGLGRRDWREGLTEDGLRHSNGRQRPTLQRALVQHDRVTGGDPLQAHRHNRLAGARVVVSLDRHLGGARDRKAANARVDR